jgi:DNA polymerase-3 subunit gamma/tau
MSLALYRKYRPSTFGEVIGEEHVTEPLSNALESGKIHHAYLFSGPRGCGKTSSARIMARSLNCEKGPTPNPCGVCQSCKDLVANGPGSIDVMELDAATHGLVDDARDLRDKAFFAPVQSRYKIYIIDEAHQLGPGAANALLKVVEEPPPHVLFIFATTEPDKLISTIRSRTHHYPFRLVPPGTLAKHLEEICEKEGVKIAKGVIPLVVRASGGSVRDALSVLGQLLAGAGKDGVTYDIAVSLLGYTDGALLDESIDAIAARDVATLFNTIDRVIEAGLDPRRFTQDLLERIRDLIVVGSTRGEAGHILRDIPEDQLERMNAQANNIGAASLIRAAEIAHEGLNQMRGNAYPRLVLELIAGKIMLPGNDDAGLLARIERIEKGISVRPAENNVATSVPPPQAQSKAAPVADKQKKSEPAAVTEPAPVKEAAVAKPSGPVDIAALRRLWPDVIENVKKRRRLTWSLLSASAQVLSVDEKAITIGIVNVGARDSFIRSGSDVILQGAFADVVGLDLKVECVVDSSVNAPVHERTTEDPSDGPQMSSADLLARGLGAKVIKTIAGE